jgi:hypothetical protein
MKERVQIALIAASGLAHAGRLFLLACSAEYRYYHYLIYTGVLASFLLLRTYLTTRFEQADESPDSERVGG